MKILKYTPTLLVLIAILLISCNNQQKKKEETSAISENISLKNKFEKSFLIGAALSEAQIKNEISSKEAEIIKNHFNSITAENKMKSMHTQPSKGEFTFEVADKFIELGQANNMFLVGHTLVWHSQLPDWVNEIKDAEEMKDFMENHIKTLVTRYKGKINGWDVVNEALNEDGTLRESIFLNLLGEDYLTTAFKLTESIDSEAELYYNDYNLCIPAKREGAIALVKKLRENGAKVDGIGVQAHWDLNYPSLEEIEKSILAYSDLGAKVMFTELDITVLPSPWENGGADVNKNFEANEKMNPYPNGLPEEIQEKLAKRYKDIFELFIKHQDKISRVTFWGVNDKQSWKNDWPIKGRTDYTLLFDRENNPKKAFNKVINIAVE